MAKLDDAGSNPLHEDGQFRTHVWSTRHCVPSLSKTAYFHCSVHMTLAVDTDVKLRHYLAHSHLVKKWHRRLMPVLLPGSVLVSSHSSSMDIFVLL